MTAAKVIKKKPTKVATRRKQALRFNIQCAPKVLDDDLISFSEIVTFLRERIKIGGKLNNLGKDVSVERTPTSVVVTSNIPFSKSMKDFIRVVASNKDSYEFRFYNFDSDSESEEEM